jgi:outer membrane protein assembly factor BamE (lipoprotein component of BamABCDE complex)
MGWLHLVLVLGILTSGCGQIAYQRFDKQMWANYVHVNELKKGMSKEEVRGIAGPPDIRESGDYPGGRYTIYFYLTHSMDFEQSNTVRNGYTPLVFKNDHLVGMGKRDYLGAVDRIQSETQEMPKGSVPWGRITH